MARFRASSSEDDEDEDDDFEAMHPITMETRDMGHWNDEELAKSLFGCNDYNL